MRRKRKTTALDGVPTAECVNVPEISDQLDAPDKSCPDMISSERRSVIQSEGSLLSADRPRDSHPIEGAKVESAVARDPTRQLEAAPAAAAALETSTFVARRSQFSGDLVEDAKRYFSSKQGEPVSDDLARNYLGSLVDFVMLFENQHKSG